MRFLFRFLFFLTIFVGVKYAYVNSKHPIKVEKKVSTNEGRKKVVRRPSGKISAASKSQRAPADLRSLGQENYLAPEISNASPAFASYSTLSLGLLYGFYRIDSKEISDGSTALLLSRPSIGFSAGWNLHWTPRFATSLNLALRQIEMRRSSTGILTNEKQNISGLGVATEYQWTEKSKSVLGVNYEERLFVRSLQSGTAYLEVYQQPSLDLKFEHEVVQAGPLSMDVMLGYRHLLKTSTESSSIKDSGEYLIGATFRQQLKEMQFEAKLNYLTSQQQSNISNQDNSGIEAQIGIKMEIGK